MTTSVGVIGVGVMGSPLSRHMLKAGLQVNVCDTQRDRVEALAKEGARPFSSPREVSANSEITLVVVVDDAQVEEVCLGPGGVLEGAKRDHVIAICSTVQPRTCREVGEKAQALQVHVLDTPMVRGAQAAVEGRLLLMVGGDPEILDRCGPVFRSFATDIYRLGGLGSGQVGKMVNNLVLWSCMAATREGVTLASREGVDPGSLREALIRGSADNYAIREYEKLCQQPKWWHQKDLDAVLRLAEDSETPVPVSALVKELIKGFAPEDCRRLMRP